VAARTATTTCSASPSWSCPSPTPSAPSLSPQVGRPKFLGLWHELSDTGQGIGPLILAAVSAVARLTAGVTVSGVIGFAAAAAMWGFIPRRSRLTSKQYERVRVQS
jgi:hypothetical protein